MHKILKGNGVLWLLVNSEANMDTGNHACVIVGSPDDVRVNTFQNALHQCGFPPAKLVTYTDLIHGNIRLDEYIPENAWVRIESPGKHPATNHLLRQIGRGGLNAPYHHHHTQQPNGDNKGLIHSSNDWYKGFTKVLRLIEGQLVYAKPHRLMNAVDDILLMFNKPACHHYLHRRGIAVPPALRGISNFKDLEQAMGEVGWRRVFVKPAYGSSASGVVAYETNGQGDHKASAAIEMVERDGQLFLYNTRKIHIYRDVATIAKLIDALCKHTVHVEAWIPKAGFDGKSFDLRVVVIGGQASHVLARLSHSPLTNLHLLNERRQRDAVIQHLGKADFERAMALCEDAMSHFPHSFYAGIDLLIAVGFHQQYIIELNAFGDLLHDTTFNGLDTHAMQIKRIAAFS